MTRAAPTSLYTTHCSYMNLFYTFSVKESDACTCVRACLCVGGEGLF